MRHWKQMICGLLGSVMVFSALPLSVWAEGPVTEEDDWVVDDITLEVQEDGTAWIKNCFQSATAVEVPAEVDGVKITGIKEGAFSECFLLESLTLPDTITTIQDSAFYGCSVLTTLQIPDSVTTFGNGTLEACTALTDVQLPETLETLPTGTFYGCTALETITLPGHLTTIGQESFYQCTALKEIAFPEQLQTIETYAFQGCSTLETMEIPASCTTIGDFAFEGCAALQEILVADDNSNYQDQDGVLFNADGTVLIKYPDSYKQVDYIVPDGCTRLEDWSFTGAASLKSIDMKNITELGEDVFFYCQSLQSIVIPESIKELPNNTFAYCTELTSVTLPSKLTSIGDFCFYTCVRLPEIAIPETVKKIGKQAFYNCLELKQLTLPSGIEELGDGAFGLYAEAEDETPSVVKNFSVTYGSNSKIKKYVSQYDIPAEVTEGSGSSWVLPVCMISGVILIAAVVVVILVMKKKKQTGKGGTA